MYEKILVPLDGSKESETILDHVRMIAGACGNPKVVVLRCVEPFSPSAVNYVGTDRAQEALKKETEAAEEYLSYVADSLRTHCGGVETVVVEGRPAEAILEYADANEVDLIAMTTHGASGPAKWAVGSTTERVMRHTKSALLTVTPEGSRA